MEKTDVAIIGAGPNGVSVAAHLKATGVERRIFGLPFSTWRDRMPNGMLLKSEPYASDVASPVPGFRVRDYCRSNGLSYANRKHPVSLATFMGYADWFCSSLVPDIEQVHITSVKSATGGFQLSTADGELWARRVVVATGVMPFAYLPDLLEGLPTSLVTHTSQHSDLSEFRGRRVGVIGRGQSALETAALLHELGAEVEVLARGPIWFHDPVLETPSFGASVRKPANPLCESWACWGYYTFPGGFRALPERVRIDKARTVLGPAGSWWLRPRLEGQVPLRTGLQITGARADGDRVRLTFDGSERGEGVYDHVIAGTGYRFDLGRLSYLAPELRSAVAIAGGAPILSRSFESSVPGLFFVGAMAAPSLGPSMRFISGTWFTARRCADRLASDQHGAGADQASPDHADRPLQTTLA